MSKRKKVVILSVMVLILGVAAFLNFTLLNNDDNDDVGASGSAGGFFATYRAIRQEERNEEVMYLDSIIGLQGEEFASARAAAVQQKLKLVEIIETELLLEQMLRARGYGDAIVSISMFSDSINVIIKGDEVTRSDTAVIYNVIRAETGMLPQAVTILATA